MWNLGGEGLLDNDDATCAYSSLYMLPLKKTYYNAERDLESTQQW